MLVLEYVRKFDKLSRYPPDMVATEVSKIQRFLNGLRPGLASLVDIGRDLPESYADAIEQPTRQEAWQEPEKKVNHGSDDKRVSRFSTSQLQFGGNWCGGRNKGRFKQGKQRNSSQS